MLAPMVVQPVVRSSLPVHRRIWRNTLVPSQQNISESPCDFSGLETKDALDGMEEMGYNNRDKNSHTENIKMCVKILISLRRICAISL